MTYTTDRRRRSKGGITPFRHVAIRPETWDTFFEELTKNDPNQTYSEFVTKLLVVWKKQQTSPIE